MLEEAKITKDLLEEAKITKDLLEEDKITKDLLDELSNGREEGEEDEQQPAGDVH